MKLEINLIVRYFIVKFIVLYDLCVLSCSVFQLWTDMMGPLEIAEPEASLPAPELGAEAEVVVKPGENHLRGTESLTKYKSQEGRSLQIYFEKLITILFSQFCVVKV